MAKDGSVERAGRVGRFERQSVERERAERECQSERVEYVQKECGEEGGERR